LPFKLIFIYINKMLLYKATGKCICNDFTEGYECNQCKPGYYGLLTNSNSTCKKCSCDPIGTDPATMINGQQNNYVCDVKTSQCTCNPNRIGVRCETCALGFFFLNLNGIDCFECNCDPIGSVPGSNCDSLTGECVCKTSNGIGGTRCNECSPGFYNFSLTTGT
jgi:usherin